MNLIAWLRWRRRVPPLDGGPIAQLAQYTAWYEAKDVDGLLPLLPSLDLRSNPDRRLRLWIVKATLWQQARLTRRVDPDLMNQFFTAFWPVFLREVHASVLINTITAEQLTARVAEFLPAVDRPRGAEAKSDKHAWFLAKEAWAFIRGAEPSHELPELMALGTTLSLQLIACAQLLDRLPSLEEGVSNREEVTK
jgi:hypothetical protein